MKCAQCQAELPEGKLFCPSCGHYNQTQNESDPVQKRVNNTSKGGKTFSQGFESGQNAKTFDPLIVLQTFLIVFLGVTTSKLILIPVLGLALIIRMLIRTEKRATWYLIPGGLLILFGAFLKIDSPGSALVDPSLIIGLGLLVFAIANDNPRFMLNSVYGGVPGIILAIALDVFILLPYAGGKGLHYNPNEAISANLVLLAMLVVILLVTILSIRRSVSEIADRKMLLRNYVIVLAWVVVGSFIISGIMAIVASIIL